VGKNTLIMTKYRVDHIFNFLWPGPSLADPEETRRNSWISVDLLISAIVLVDKAFFIGISPESLAIFLPTGHFFSLREESVSALSVFITKQMRNYWQPEDTDEYQVVPLPAGLKNPPHRHPNLNYTPPKYILPIYSPVMVKFNPMDDYKRQQPSVDDQEADMVHVLEMLAQPELLSYFKLHRTNYSDSSMTALLSLIVKPELDKFKDRLEFNLGPELFKRVMLFSFWFFTYHQIYDTIPRIQEQYNEKEIEVFAREHATNAFVQQFSRVNDGGDTFDYDAVCLIFEDCFHFMPPKQLLEVPDLYMSSLDGLELSPAMGALLTNMAVYQPEKDSVHHDLCFWSQPSVNHRDIDLLRLQKLHHGFLHNPKNVKGLSSEEYTCFPYVVTNPPDLAGGNASSMTVESMIKPAKLKQRLVAESLFDQSTEAEKFYKFVAGEEFDRTVLDNDDLDLPKPFKIFASALHMMNQKYNGLGSIESLRQLYRDLLKPLFSVDPFPLETMNIMSDDYRQLFHCCRIVFQASFPFRLGMIDGGHRIITALASIYNLKPTTNLARCEGFLDHWATDDATVDDEIVTLDLGKVCGNARFKMCWPNCPLVNNKQNYDLSVSSALSVSEDIRRNEHHAFPPKRI
jgi:hypothetical protein